MAQYPTNTEVRMPDPINEQIEFKTVTVNFDYLGKEQRRQKWLYPKRMLEVRYPYISKTQARTIWAFYVARAGSYEAFRFFYPYSNTYTKEYVGTGDGSTVLYTLPSYQAASYTLYVDGVAQSAGGTDYTFTSEGGTDGADKAVFVNAPGDGTRITWTFTGYLVCVCRFAEDNLTFDMLYLRLHNMGIKLRCLLNDAA